MPHRVLLMISSMRGGGSEVQTLMLLRHLDRSLFTPHLYLTERAGELLSEVPADVSVHAYSDGEPGSGIYFPGRELRRQVRSLCNVIEQNEIDVIYDRTFHMSLIAGPAEERCGTPRVSTIVSPPADALPMVESRFVELKRRRLAKAYRDSHAVVAVSKIAADCAEQYYNLPSSSVQVIHNAVDTEAIRKLSSKSAPSGNDRLTLVCVGRMTAEKGHRDLVAAINDLQHRWPDDLPSVRLQLVGDGPLRSELEALCEKATGRHTVEFLGKQASAIPFISSADALVLPSHFEGMPNVVLEAMALQTPVIATSAGGTIELQREEPTILWAEPGRPESLAEAILQLAHDRDGAKARVSAATELVERHHNISTTTQAIEQLLIEASS